MKAVIYTRFSPRRNADTCESCEAQRAACTEYCEAHELEVVGYFEDRAASGADEDRPGLWNAINAVHDKTALVVWKFDRLAREVYLHCAIERQILAQRGIIISASGEGEISKLLTSEQKLMMDIIRAFTAYERRIIAARTSAAMIRRQNNGEKMSSQSPYGWKPDPADPCNRIVEDPVEQAGVQMILTLRREGRSCRLIADALMAAKVPSRGAKGWHPMGVYRAVERLKRNGKL